MLRGNRTPPNCPETSLDLDPGHLVAQRFRILRPLGRGGMGEVFAAENLRTGRQVAVKLLRSESKQKSSAIERFRREARAAGSIQSDFVTQILDVDEDPEHGIVLVFELLEGESLVDRLKRTGPIPFDELHPMIEQIWMGLADAHRAGIVHRDLKPSNVFLERRPNGGVRVKILDFGISKLPREMGGETLTELGQSLGTFSFMPPEQIGKAKTVDHRADIYSCASLIYQALSGQLPYAAKNILMMVELKTKTEPRRLSAVMDGVVDPRLDEFLSISLARDPENRFQTSDDALAAWRALAGTDAGRATVGTSAAQGRGDVVHSPFVSPGHVPNRNAEAQRHVTPGFAPVQERMQSPGFQSRGPVSVPRANTSDSWDDSAPPSESHNSEDAATIAIRRDQVGLAVQQYARMAASGGQVPRLTADDVRTTNQGTLMMMKSPMGSMHRPKGQPSHESASSGNTGGGGMMSPALMPPMHPHGHPHPQGMQYSKAESQPMRQPEGRRSTWTFVIGAILLALASFAVIAVLLELVVKR